MEASARQTLMDLSQAYSQKKRDGFMSLISKEAPDINATLDEAVRKDFQNYNSVNLDTIIDNVTIQNDRIFVVFRYNLTLVDRQGAYRKDSGVTNFTFRWENQKAKLYRMAVPPLIFGNSLPSSQNPIARSQGTPAATSGTAPGSANSASSSSPAVSGSSHISSDPVGTQETASGFYFKTQSTTGPSGGDIFLGPIGDCASASPCIHAASSGAIQSFGSCSLGSLSSVPTPVSGAQAAAVAGNCYAVRTPDSHYAAIRVTSINSTDGTMVNFDYSYQPNGTASLR